MTDLNRLQMEEFRTARAKLTAEQVIAIRRRASTELRRALAAEFGVSRGTIARVVGGISYRHVILPD
ncbi:hypothetical protein [Actinopolymorpha pittospori]|uniref:Uncharacterized protein n=1 Tax=Actinopolymorpha pittospori TaxID=648752 RepID=A0A927MPX3_9ACTN|nr:hypothetical protein [Actinopolymorpha pittospori]MBE1603914.1 hypothetical protein [Actinopolymorpha pittospori]